MRSHGLVAAARSFVLARAPLLAALAFAAIACSTSVEGLDPDVGPGGAGGGSDAAVDVGKDASVSCETPARLKSRGASCGCDGECATGFCVAGICCSSACDGACLACDVAGLIGTCSPVPAGDPPALADQCPKDPVASCGRDGLCDGNGACRKFPDNTICEPGRCGEGVLTDEKTCQAGACAPSGRTEICAPFMCSAAEGGCRERCESDADCVPGRKCESGSCGKRVLGARCKQAADCESGFCADGVCCNTGCDGACASCNQAGSMGTCRPVAEGVRDPHKQCMDQGPASCGISGACDGKGGCARYAAGTVCSPPACSGGSLVPAGVCNGQGTCLQGAPVACAPYLCKNGACGESCDGDSDCVVGSACANRSCGKRGLGQRCADADQCLSGFCVEGVCCTEACDGRCRTCSAPSAPGRCVNVPMGQPDPRAAAGEKDPARVCLDQGPASCGTNGRCDGAGGCERYPSGTSCRGESCDAATGTFTGESTCNGSGQCMPPGPIACAPYRCNGTRCATSCLSDGMCAGGNTCVGGSCGKKGNGQICTRDDECQSTHCEQGVCCATACASSCFSCAQNGSLGTCAAVPAGGKDPAGLCRDQGAPSCGQDGTCDGSGKCRLYPSGTTCAQPSCANGTQQALSICNGVGTCVAGSPRSCAPYTCNASGSACYDTCGEDRHCTAPNRCMQGRCGRGDLGASCSAAADCMSNFCVDGVCCDGACEGACRACNLPSAPGRCAFIAEGTADSAGACAASAASSCGNDGTCDGKGGCRKWRSTTQCRPPSCAAGTTTATKAAFCDGLGNPCPAGATQSCGDFQCDAASGSCKTSCTVATQANDCMAGKSCTQVGGIMTCGLKPKGGACGNSNECASGLACVDGTCCGSVSCPACQSCGNSAGECRAVAADTVDARCAQNGQTCGFTGKCASGGVCQVAASGTACGTSCTADGLSVQGKACNGQGQCGDAGTPVSCGAYRCANGACRNTCTSADQCSTGNICYPNGTCGPPRKANGATCTQSDECNSGNCVDRTCCAQSSCGTCQTCANATGTCANVPNDGADPDSCAASGTACGATGKCDGAGKCKVAALGTRCGTATCTSNGAGRSVQVCDGSGQCVTTTLPCPGNFRCQGDNGCRNGCNNNNHCAPGFKCAKKQGPDGVCE